MAASCYLCANGVCNAIAGVSARDPLGACQNCSIFACSGHAHFDSSYPRWICVSCDTAHLTGAGIASSGIEIRELPLASHIPSTLIDQGSRFGSVDVFLELRPSYVNLMAGWESVYEVASDRFTDPRTCEFWHGLSEDGRKLLAAAIHIVNRLDIPVNQLIKTLRELILMWRVE